MTDTIRGVNIACYPNPNGQAMMLDDFKRAYDDLQQAGGNGVAINPIHYALLQEGTATLGDPPPEYGIPWKIWPGQGQGYAPWPTTISPDLVYLACAEAKARKLTVMLKPMIDPVTKEGQDGWRGDLSVVGVSDEFLYSYRYNFLLRYADIAASTDIDALCIGTEMLQVTRDMGGQWLIPTAYSARATGFKGIVTYAANWGVSNDAEYALVNQAGAWPYMERVGVNAYYELLQPGVPVDTAYEQAVYDGWHRKQYDWAVPYDDDLAALCGGDLPKLWFPELGYRADTDAAVEPGADPSTGTFCPEAQIACITAARRKWDGKVGAIFWWNWALYGSPDPRSHNLRGRAEAARAALAPAQ